ncbi:ComEC/Rec2 family competence protein [Prevotella stercorea]|uniref:ComEC/Rec2 family competence protein n=1 Tax=Leyella stercorea TaxID=363265 RepID=UPI001F3BE42B|nr:ComEC/Rec2 family competence protein [Leyella stercorea]MCF2577943.1 ComEC/Rec2 family competence protein [Leyella stercorea]
MNTQMYPFLRIAIVLVAGIMTGDVLYGHVSVRLVLWILVALVCATVVVYKKADGKKLTTLLLMLDVFVLGIWNVGRVEQRLDVPINRSAEMYDAVVAERPVVGQRTIRCVLAVAEGRLAGQRIIAFFQKDSAIGDVQRLAVGDGVRVVSRLKPITNSRRLQNGHFDYVRYQHIHGVVARTYINKDSWKRSRVSMRRLGVMQRVLIGMRSARDRLLSHNEKHNMSESAYAVVAAMTMGDRSGLTRELRQSYAASGASHVLALSGLHLGVIYGLLSLIFVHRRMRVLGQVLAMVAIWAYAALVGMPPSVLRSATMLTIFAFVVLTGRRQVSLNTLAFAAVVQLVVSPLSLWDVGFQMSFLAVLGIVMLNMRLGNLATPVWLSRWRVIGWVWSLVKVSLAAQIAVAPLSMYYFGTFPCYFLLTNLVAIPLATIIVYTSIVMYALGFCAWMQGVVATFVGWMATLMNTSLGFIASLPGACMYGIHINARQVWLMYALLLVAYLMSYYIERRNITTESRSALDKL